MKDLVDYIRQYDTTFSTRIRGAKPQEIAEMEQLLGRKLPSRYAEFLLLMGKDMGSLDIPEADLRIDRILKACRSSNRLPSRYILVGFDKGDPPYNFYLDCDSVKDGDGHIVRADSGAIRDTSRAPDLAFISLREMLFVFAFLFKRMSYLPHRKVFSAPRGPNLEGVVTTQPGLLEATSEVASMLGFKQLPYAGPLHLLFERGDAALYASKDSSSNAFSAELATREPPELKRLKEIFHDHTGLT